MSESADCLVLAVVADPDLARTMRRSDYVVEVISDSRDALARLQTAIPALLILDLDVVDFDTLAYIRQQPRLAATRIVVITADVVCVHGLGGRVDGELLKPVRPNDLNEWIAQYANANPTHPGESRSASVRLTGEV